MDLNENTAIIDMKRSFHKFLSSADTKRPKLDSSPPSDSNLLDSPQVSNLRESDVLKAKTELIYCKTRIGMLETQLCNKEAEMKEQAALHDREVSELKRIHERELRGYNVLKTSHERVLQRQELCEVELKEEKANSAYVKQLYEDKIRDLQKKNLDQESSYTQSINEERSKCRELRNKLLSQHTDHSVVTVELTQVKEQLNELRRKHSEAQICVSESDDWKKRATVAEEKVKELESSMQTYQDDIAILAARKQDLTNLSKLKEECKTLTNQVMNYKLSIENLEIMKEKVQTLERKLSTHENLQQKVAKLELENENLVKKLASLQEKQIAEDTLLRLKEALDKEAVMVENIGQLVSRNRSLEARVNEFEDSQSSLKAKLSGAGDKNEKFVKEMDSLKRKLQLLTKERDGYKRIIESYDSDVTRMIVPHSADKVTQLQSMLDDYIKVNSQLEKDIQSRDGEILKLRQEAAEVHAANEKLTQKSQDFSAADKVEQNIIVDLRKKIEELEKRCETLQEERDILEARIEQRNLQGDYDPTKTKVLHLKMNPASMAQMSRAEEVKRLCDENKRLRERVKVLEQRVKEANDLTTQVEANLNSTQIQDSQQLKEVKAKLASSEQKFERMMEVCQKATSDFRRTVLQLTGYRIDIPRNQEYKLMSMYSSSPDDFLLFRDTDGVLQFLETDFASTLESLAEEYLHKQDSIPAFLSALTLELYKQQTMSVSMVQ